MQLTGAEILIQALKSEEVDTIFGYPGGTVIPCFDALGRCGGDIRRVLTSHEQGAIHAADGYARSTGRVGVCLVTSGPGATNLVTGIATAYMDSVPVVALTVNVSTDNLGKDSFQEVDIAGVTMPVTKHNFIVKDVNKLYDTVRRAFKIASSGRPGPVLIDITKDVTKAVIDFDAQTADSGVHESMREDNATEEELKKAVKLIQKSLKPLIVVGGGAGISHATSRIETLVEMLGCPVTDTLMGKGTYSENKKGYIGMCGMYGSEACRQAFRDCDLIIAIGTRFSERVTHNSPDFAPNAKIVQIDIDRAELNKNIRVDAAIAGDASLVIEDLLVELNSVSIKNREKHREWREKIKSIYQKEKNQSYKDKDVLNGPAIVRTISDMADESVIVATEVGLNQMWAATNFAYTRPGQLLTSGGLGTMGYGLGAAIGASVAHPETTVINFAGDGCFRMNMNELLTAVRLHLPIVEVIFDNRQLGMVHMLQDKFYEGRFIETEFHDDVDYAAISAAMGAHAVTVATVGELKKAYSDAVARRDVSVIVAKI